MAAGISPIEIRTVAAANGTVAILVHPPVRASSVLASAFAVSSMLQQPDQHPGWLQALAQGPSRRPVVHIFRLRCTTRLQVLDQLGLGGGGRSQRPRLDTCGQSQSTADQSQILKSIFISNL
jgi:hypothetical protein